MIRPAMPLFLVCGLCAGAAPLAAEIELISPRGGWHDDRLDGETGQIAAAYPKPPVDRGGQRQRTLIRGRLDPAPGLDQPGTLVVNGTPMPLYSDAQGSFARPYVFGRGSNSVEIRHPGGARKRLQFIEANPSKPQARLRAILTWDAPKAEVDLHVITPDGQHATWSSPILRDGGGFDVDSVDGAGPEIFSTANPQPGVYHFYVNYWGNFDAAGYNFAEAGQAGVQDIITVRLTIIGNENTAAERRATYVVPLRQVGDLTHVHSYWN
jgi:uncharacterized protein YfaP (DUF2135 family)